MTQNPGENLIPNPFQKDKPAPTSRNYNKMRNRLRGILKKKREVEEYFEYHPDTPAQKEGQESQQQVIFTLKVLLSVLINPLFIAGRGRRLEVHRGVRLRGEGEQREAAGQEGAAEGAAGGGGAQKRRGAPKEGKDDLKGE